MDRVRQLSTEIIQARQPNVTDQREAAELLEAYLRDSPEFSYSLDLSIDEHRHGKLAQEANRLLGVQRTELFDLFRRTKN